MGTPDQYSTGPAMCVVPHVMRCVYINQSHTPTAQKHHSFHVCLVKCPRWPYGACVFHACHRQTTRRHPTHHQRGSPVQWSVSQWLVWYTTNNTGCVSYSDTTPPGLCPRTYTPPPPKRDRAQDTKQHSTVLWDAHTVLCVRVPLIPRAHVLHLQWLC